MTKTTAHPPPEGGFHLVTSRWTEPFWQAARERRLTAARCGDCGQFRMPPTPFCPACLSQQIEWATLSGRAVLFSYTIVAPSRRQGMEGTLPYVPCVAELPDAGGVRLVSNVVGCVLDRLAVGQGLRVAWHERSDGVVLPHFRLEDDSE